MTRTLLALLALAGTAAASPSVDRVVYPNGKPRFEFELQAGVPNGRGRGWNANGTLAFEGTYVDGARQGRFKLYDGNGVFVAQAIYFDNAEVWRSTDPAEQPPEQWTTGLQVAHPGAGEEELAIERGFVGAKGMRPSFALLDRTTAPARAGAQLGLSDADSLGFPAATRLDVFGHYRIGAFGVFAQISETHLSADADTLAGRRTMVLAGTYHREVLAGTVSVSAGVIAPIANANPRGFVAALVGAEQRPADEAQSLPAPYGVRTAATLTRARGHVVVQLDGGVDWMVGGPREGLDPLVRGDLGIGIGTSDALALIEVANTVRALDPDTHHHAIAAGGHLALHAVWLGASLARSDAGTTSLLATVGHDL